MRDRNSLWMGIGWILDTFLHVEHLKIVWPLHGDYDRSPPFPTLGIPWWLPMYSVKCLLTGISVPWIHTWSVKYIRSNSTPSSWSLNRALFPDEDIKSRLSFKHRLLTGNQTTNVVTHAQWSWRGQAMNVIHHPLHGDQFNPDHIVTIIWDSTFLHYKYRMKMPKQVATKMPGVNRLQRSGGHAPIEEGIK